MEMYFFNIEPDCQDRDLGLNIEIPNLAKVADEQGSIVDDSSFTNGDLLIHRIYLPSTIYENTDKAKFELNLANPHEDPVPMSNVVDIFGNFNSIFPPKQMPFNDVPASSNPAKGAQNVPINPLIKKIDKRFSDFVGMQHLKEEVYRQASFIKVQELRKERSIAVAASPSKHMVFKGNPGTGKTTVARILADVYYELGVLRTNNVIETDRSGLIAEYLGQTAIKTREVIESAIDGVLFIDEAYSLTEKEHNDYGAEAIDTLVKMIEDHRDNLVVIVAGYGDEMNRFISSNPGLASRFNRYMC